MPLQRSQSDSKKKYAMLLFFVFLVLCFLFLRERRGRWKDFFFLPPFPSFSHSWLRLPESCKGQEKGISVMMGTFNFVFWVVQ